ncbi:MAG: hypothetical protein ACLPX1_11040 [Steroidobacteraceae bacterium]
MVVLPVYYASVMGINHHNKKAIMTEFKRRCLPLNWSNVADSAATVLPLDFLHALHVPAAVVDQAAK